MRHQRLNISNKEEWLKASLSDEDEILRIKIIKLEEPYLWYKNDVGNEFDVIDFRYQNMYKVIDRFCPFDGHAIGYVRKDHCEIIKIIQARRVPDFPFKVKITGHKNCHEQCWYYNKIGDVFEITKGGIDWSFKGGERWYSIQKQNCEIIK